MQSITCPECAQEISANALTCPHCGGTNPSRRNQLVQGYEWKSDFTWMGSPLVHVAFGTDAGGRVRTARGIIAIGQRAVGMIAIGILAGGFVSVGIVSLGVFAGGIVSVAAFAACGVNAIGPVAIGFTAFGWIAGGVAPLGWKILFSVTR